MAHHWHDGFADRQDPQAPIGSPLGSGITLVQPPTRILPEQFVVCTAPHQNHAQAQAQDPGAAPDDWQMVGGQPSKVSVATEPGLANAWWPCVSNPSTIAVCRPHTNP